MHICIFISIYYPISERYRANPKPSTPYIYTILLKSFSLLKTRILPWPIGSFRIPFNTQNSYVPLVSFHISVKQCDKGYRALLNNAYVCPGLGSTNSPTRITPATPMVPYLLWLYHRSRQISILVDRLRFSASLAYSTYHRVLGLYPSPLFPLWWGRDWP